MPYTINKTNGDVLVTVPDGSVDTTTTDIALIGKNAPTYGEYLNENFVKLLENFSSGSEPATPLVGQLWYDSGGDNRIKVFNGSSFRPISGAIVGTSQPDSVTSVVGDIWLNSNTGQLYVKHATGWRLVGPTWSVTDNTLGVQVDTLIDTGTSTSKKVLGLYSNGTRIAIVSDHTAFSTSVTGFSTVGKGITLNSSLSSNKFHGIATEAESVSGFTPSSFMRADANTGTTGTLTIDHDDGLILGESSELSVHVSSHDVYIDNTFPTSDIYFRTNDGATDSVVLAIDGDNNRVGVLTLSPSVEFEVTGDGKFSGDLTVTGNVYIENPTIPSTGDSSTQVATTEFVRQEINALIDAAPGALNTLNEIAIALNNDANFASTLTTSIDGKLSKSGGTMTGKLTLDGTPINDLHAATKKYVDDQLTSGTDGLYPDRIYSGTYGTSDYTAVLCQGPSGISVTVNNSTVLQTASDGIVTMHKNLKLVPTTFSVSESYTGDYSAVHAKFVKDATNYWGGSTKYVSTSAPTSGQGQDGDIWFQREA